VLEPYAVHALKQASWGLSDSPQLVQGVADMPQALRHVLPLEP